MKDQDPGWKRRKLQVETQGANKRVDLRTYDGISASFPELFRLQRNSAIEHATLLADPFQASYSPTLEIHRRRLEGEPVPAMYDVLKIVKKIDEDLTHNNARRPLPKRSVIAGAALMTVDARVKRDRDEYEKSLSVSVNEGYDLLGQVFSANAGKAVNSFAALELYPHGYKLPADLEKIEETKKAYTEALEIICYAVAAAPHMGTDIGEIHQKDIIPYLLAAVGLAYTHFRAEHSSMGIHTYTDISNELLETAFNLATLKAKGMEQTQAVSDEIYKFTTTQVIGQYAQRFPPDKSSKLQLLAAGISDRDKSLDDLPIDHFQARVKIHEVITDKLTREGVLSTFYRVRIKAIDGKQDIPRKDQDIEIYLPPEYSATLEQLKAEDFVTAEITKRKVRFQSVTGGASFGDKQTLWVLTAVPKKELGV